jgi:hypothetical protein
MRRFARMISNIWSPPFFLTLNVSAHLGQFLNISNMFSVKSPDKTLQIVHLSRLVTKYAKKT